MSKFTVIALLLFASADTFASEHALAWRGYQLREVASIAEIPPDIVAKLHTFKYDKKGIADFGKPFNATDVVDSSLPMRRLLAAAKDGDAWLVALERGGRGYNIQVFLFPGDESHKYWVLLASPTSMQELLPLIPATPDPDYRHEG